MGQKKKKKSKSSNNNHNKASTHNYNHNHHEKGDHGINKIRKISSRIERERHPKGKFSLSKSKENVEIFKSYIEAGGEECFKFFRYLFKYWKTHGSLPSLDINEFEMMHKMYQYWLVHQRDEEERASDSSQDNDDDCSENSQNMSISSCIESLKENVKKRFQSNDSLASLVSQLEILLKAPEPTRTQAHDLLDTMLSHEFLERDINSLQEIAECGSSSCYVVLALLFDSERTLVSMSDTGAISKSDSPSGKLIGNVVMKYYLKALQISNCPIAAMLLGSKYLKGQDIKLDYKAAFKLYVKSAQGNNPISQHKMGLFYDEGLPNGVCEVDVIEAVKWYSQAAELMPESMHNLAKIYEDGRGGIEPDMQQAITLYSVAAARGFALSQANLGRLFLLGEDNVAWDREAGKRLLTLAAESGEADAQMIVGMIHATSAFECFDLQLSEYWLRLSLQGGKSEARRLLERVTQQLQLSNLQPIDKDSPKLATPLSKSAAAAKKRGDDYLSHGLLHAAVLEYSRAFELDKTQLSYFVDRLEALTTLEHYEECLTDSSLLLPSLTCQGEEIADNGRKSRADNNNPYHFLCDDANITEKEFSMSRLYGVIANCLERIFCRNVEQCFKMSNLRKENVDNPTASNGQIALDYLSLIQAHHREAILSHLVNDCLGWSAKSSRVIALIDTLTSQDIACVRCFIRQGGIPVVLSLLQDAQGTVGLCNLETYFKNESQDTQLTVTADDILLHVWWHAINILQHICSSSLSNSTIQVIAATDGFSILSEFVLYCYNRIRVTFEDSQQKCNYRLIRVSVGGIQLLATVACTADKAMWSEIMRSNMVDCVCSTTINCRWMLPKSNQIIHFDNMVNQNAVEAHLIILGNMVHAIARILKSSPKQFLIEIYKNKEAISSLQAILNMNTEMDDAGKSIDNFAAREDSSLLHDISSAAAFVLCKILCAVNPSHAETLIKNLSKDKINEIIMGFDLNESVAESKDSIN